jgi:hypothetical protein
MKYSNTQVIPAENKNTATADEPSSEGFFILILAIQLVKCWITISITMRQIQANVCIIFSFNNYYSTP